MLGMTVWVDGKELDIMDKSLDYNDKVDGASVDFVAGDQDVQDLLSVFDAFDLDGEYLVEDLRDFLDWALVYDDLAKLAFLADLNGDDIIEAWKRYKDEIDAVTFYPGYSFEDWMDDMINQGILPPSTIKNYVDYDKLARDMTVDGWDERRSGVYLID